MYTPGAGAVTHSTTRSTLHSKAIVSATFTAGDPEAVTATATSSGEVGH